MASAAAHLDIVRMSNPVTAYRTPMVAPAYAEVVPFAVEMPKKL
jgi:hypothetical protein